VMWGASQFLFLPHALRATKRSASSIDQMLLTDPPQRTVILTLLRKCHAITTWEDQENAVDAYEDASGSIDIKVTRKTGVPLGDVLRSWATSNQIANKAAPVALTLRALAATQRAEVRNGICLEVRSAVILREEGAGLGLAQRNIVHDHGIFAGVARNEQAGAGHADTNSAARTSRQSGHNIWRFSGFDPNTARKIETCAHRFICISVRDYLCERHRFQAVSRWRLNS
jgi:hypothetical protein